MLFNYYMIATIIIIITVLHTLPYIVHTIYSICVQVDKVLQTLLS